MTGPRRVALTVTLTFSLGLSAKPPEKKKEGLSLDDYIFRITRRLPSLKEKQAGVERARQRVRQTEAVDDLTISSRVHYRRQVDRLSGGGFGDDTTGGIAAGIEARKAFSLTGTRIQIGVDYSAMKIEKEVDGLAPVPAANPTNPGFPPPGVFFVVPFSEDIDDTHYEPKLSLGIKQPLLSNFLGVQDRVPRQKALLGRDLADLSAVTEKTRQISYYRKLYFDWVTQKQTLQYIRQTIEAAKRLQSQVRRKYSGGLADLDDLRKAQSSVTNIETRLSQAMARQRNIRYEVSIYLDAERFHPLASELTSVYQKALDYDYRSVRFSRTLRAQRLSLNKKVLLLDKTLYEKRILPSLMVAGDMTLKTSETDALEAVTEKTYVDYSVGLQFSYPLYNHAAIGALKEQKAAIDELNHAYNAAKNEFQTRLFSIINRVKMTKENLRLRKKNITALKSRYAAEKRKYNQARLNLSYLINTETTLLNDRIDLLTLRLQLVKNYYDYLSLIK